MNERGRGNDWLRIGGLKGFVDGSLGSHTAAFLEPFSDAPGDTRVAREHRGRPRKVDKGRGPRRACKSSCTRSATGRSACNSISIERVAKANGPRDRRFRIEHAQHIAPADLPRFAKLGVIASMQPYHAIDDGRWAERSIGAKRCETTYAFRSLLDSGARSRSAAIGLSRRRRRWKASTRR